MSHTPGPWLRKRSYPSVITDNSPLPGTPICEVYQPNQETNAHLIAAAPDLYEAVKLAFDVLRQDCSCVEGKPCTPHETMTAAIAHAEGRT